ncbi:MAG: ribulose-phosphate 3-epimerase [Candidatus Omnitrophota bacterium]|jgi:ribulose-phosphate 3-epimerase
MKIKIAPSILSADFSCLAEQIKKVECAGADMLHVDVMDGHFVPNITIGPVVVKDIRKVTKLPLDVHLMIEHPEEYVESFLKAGSDMITFHIETILPGSLRKQAAALKEKGIQVGVSLNPKTPLAKIKSVLDCVDFVLVMTVNPGFGGQAFMPEVVGKIKMLRQLFLGDIAVDGGINALTAKIAVNAGANVLAAGSYIFSAKDIKKAIERIRNVRKW